MNQPVNLDDRQARARREFLKYLAASPCIAAFGGLAAFLEQGGIGVHAEELPQAAAAAAPSLAQEAQVIASPAQALDVFDFEEPAHRKMLPGHWAYMVSGVDDDATLRANREGFNHIQLRPRRLRDMAGLDAKATLLGTTYASPIFTCPTGGERGIWLQDGELSVARAAKARNTLQMLSNATSKPVEEVNAALGRPVVFQVYAPPVWTNCETLLKRVEAAGCTAIDLTVDIATGRNLETDLRLRPKDLRVCGACHEGDRGDSGAMSKGFDMTKGISQAALDWPYVDKMRQVWKGKFGIKGILTREDAALCLQHGIDYIHVSNHGGRSTETMRSTIATLPEIVAEVNGRVPVFVDGGFRRGTDVFKALALGATAVGIGRPMLWGLGSFGQAGVDRVLEIMQSELRLAMANCGTHTLAEITRDYVTSPDWKI
jgi:isopentenyl diphosphate isomerase/L-lactate dehydrogenase-like FMN-dependent dehydrogenase